MAASARKTLLNSVPFWRFVSLFLVGSNMLCLHFLYSGRLCKENPPSLEHQPLYSTQFLEKAEKARGCQNKSLIGDLPLSSTEIEPIMSFDALNELLCPPKPEHPRCALNNTITNPAMDTVNGEALIFLEDKLNKKRYISIDDVAQGYQQLFELSKLFTFPNFLGVPLQQDPNDAFALMDLIWRLKPDMLIELGTAGGGSAFFYSFIMTNYNPNAKVITIDPKRTNDWNKQELVKICPHCTYARDTPVWKSGAIEFLKMTPCDAVDIISSRIEEYSSKRVLVMDDGNHLYKTVLENAECLSRFVTPGSYYIIQDMKMSRIFKNKRVDVVRAAQDFLKLEIARNFSVDRTFEYYYLTQHARGFLKRKNDVGPNTVEYYGPDTSLRHLHPRN